MPSRYTYSPDTSVEFRILLYKISNIFSHSVISTPLSLAKKYLRTFDVICVFQDVQIRNASAATRMRKMGF